MSSNPYLVIIISILAGNYIFRTTIEFLNAFSLKPDLPSEFKGYYDETKYKKSQQYLQENTYFKLAHSTVSTIIILCFILFGFFNFIDQLLRGFVSGEIILGLLFGGAIFLIFQLIDIPFSLYQTFVLEEKYGFNRTTAKTFILDLLKSWLLTFIIGGIVFSVVIWFFLKFQTTAWIWCWLAMTVFQLFLTFIAPVWIMPLFNKFIPLESGELKESIETYAKDHAFKLKGIFTMDGSKRSSKSNAFFTGFGKYRRIVFFDTLIKKHTVGELVSVLAHEMGHYKKKHILKHIVISILTTGLLFFILSFFINNPNLFAAFRMDNLSVYGSLFFFGFLYTPINLILSIFLTILSRKHEYEADEYAVTTYKHSQDFIEALKKLTVDNLSNLTPHPLKVFIDYTHPPVLKRIEAIRALNPNSV